MLMQLECLSASMTWLPVYFGVAVHFPEPGSRRSPPHHCLGLDGGGWKYRPAKRRRPRY